MKFVLFEEKGARSLMRNISCSQGRQITFSLTLESDSTHRALQQLRLAVRAIAYGTVPMAGGA